MEEKEKEYWNKLWAGVCTILEWKRMKAGKSFPSEAVVLYDHDPDPRLSRVAIYDGWYILVKELVEKLPKEQQA